MDALIGLNREDKKFQIKPRDKTEKAKHIPEHKHIYNKKTDWVLTYVTCFGPANQTWLLWLWTMALVCARPVLQGTMLLV